MVPNKDSFNLSVSTLNCHGLKGNFEYVRKLSSDYCVNFICEHWLHPSDLNSIQDILDMEGKWSHMRSSIDPVCYDKGRPFGGLGFICQKKDNISYRVIEEESDRVSAIQILSSESVIALIVGVYLPHHDGTVNQCEMYMDTINKIQGIVDMNEDGVPLLIIGDFNTVLPQMDILKTKWFKSKPFNRNSGILYGFIGDNNLCAANLVFKQTVNFTFSNSSTSSYIDHILMPDCVR